MGVYVIIFKTTHHCWWKSIYVTQLKQQETKLNAPLPQGSFHNANAPLNKISDKGWVCFSMYECRNVTYFIFNCLTRNEKQSQHQLTNILLRPRILFQQPNRSLKSLVACKSLYYNGSFVRNCSQCWLAGWGRQPDSSSYSLALTFGCLQSLISVSLRQAMQLQRRRLHFSSIVRLVVPSSDLTGSMTSPICQLADKCSSSCA